MRRAGSFNDCAGPVASSRGSSGSGALLFQFHQDLVSGDALTAVEFVETHLNFAAHFFQLSRAEPVLVFEQPQSFADDFAGRLVSAALHLAGDELFEFGRE